jgi:hypothetical protein
MPPLSSRRLCRSHVSLGRCAACAARSAAFGFAERVGAHPLRVDVRCVVYAPQKFLDVPHWP